MHEDWRKITGDFETAKERELWVREHADSYTVVRSLGPRRGYERIEVPDLAQAIDMAGRMAVEAGKAYMIYAVAGSLDAMVCYFDSEGNRHDAK